MPTAAPARPDASDLGQDQFAPATVEKLGAEMRLENTDLLGGRRLGEKEPLACSREGPLLTTVHKYIKIWYLRDSVHFTIHSADRTIASIL